MEHLRKMQGMKPTSHGRAHKRVGSPDGCPSKTGCLVGRGDPQPGASPQEWVPARVFLGLDGDLWGHSILPSYH